ncbi:MAG: trypsin-like peptidase domain-containing protein [Elusimicrobia bacterium]|nr:trypsin-like peptidase domain-containing protein [Elusimicrobiota bacterium]
MNRWSAAAASAAFVLSSGAAWGLRPEEENTIKVFSEASPSVVFVTNIAVERSFYLDEFAIPQGSGSGFIWDRSGYVVTNYHVVRGGDIFLVKLKDHTELKARFVGAEPRKDIAVLKVEAPQDKLRPLPLGDSGSLQVGQDAIAIGNPFGLDNTLTTGIVSALGRQVEGVGGVTIRDMIQTDAAINPGNSGGPLLDSGGRLIGMNTTIVSRTGTNSGVGFAVPVSFIKRIVPQLIKYGKVIQPGMGVSILTEGQKYYLIGAVSGVVIREVSPGGPAEKAGLRGIGRDRVGGFVLGDIIVGINDDRIANYDDLYNALDRCKVGDTVTVKVVRDGKKKSFPVELVNVL